VEARVTTVAAPYFFLSHAPSSANMSGSSATPDVWPLKLFGDLCDRIRRHGGLPAATAKDVGFMGEPQQPGGGDPSGRLRALATCRVFVPLFSRRYFESDDCGREWFAFTRRVANSAARGLDAVEPVIPALWAPVDERRLPAAVGSIQFNHADLGECYAAYGFYRIIKLSRYQDAYRTAVDRLARLIVRAAEASPIAPEPVAGFESLANAFEPEGRGAPGGRPLRITIVAPRRAELPDSRHGTHYYGDDAYGWNPYAPDAVRGLAEHAANLARALGYRPEVGDLGKHGEQLLRDEPPSSPEVLVVDAWAARIDPYASQLRRLNDMNKPWVQVVVPWQRSDAENEAAEAELRSSLNEALGRKLAEGRAISSSAVNGVPTLDAFSSVLPAVIMTAARQYLRYAQSYPPPSRPGAERPRLSLSMPDLLNTELPGA
jgi:FxsC-like protein